MKYSPNIQGFVLVGGRPPKPPPPLKFQKKKSEKKGKVYEVFPKYSRICSCWGETPQTPL